MILNFRRISQILAISFGLSASVAEALSGRQIDLYAIRSGKGQSEVPPDMDKLPCSYFKQGPAFNIPAVSGGPPLALQGPVQNNYSGVWGLQADYTFKFSVYKRIYHDAGIPDWLANPPTSRNQEYVIKLFLVTISAPNTASCKISARAIN